ncbi:MAG: hypothetical protein H7235_03250 [Bdellovibrionaceae bacterium]|nr:hypothetical protein [Pseudobdellovibrionaceae bacterium]
MEIEKPVWTQNFFKDMSLPRSIYADSSDLSGEIWFAFESKKYRLCRYRIARASNHSHTEELILEIESFQIQLGHLIEKQITKDLEVSKSSLGEILNRSKSGCSLDHDRFTLSII